MEYALGGKTSCSLSQSMTCLNPCCNGICSWSYGEWLATMGTEGVLILILMEYTLGVDDLVNYTLENLS